MRNAIGVSSVLWLALVGCAPPEAPPGDTTPAEPGSTELLPKPFTSEQIRDEMGLGLSIVLRHTTADEVALHRWTVVAADDEGVEIEYATIDESGQPLGEPRREWSGWDELRDHATFFGRTTTRERVELATPLGTLAGWLYRTEESDPGSIRETFFADALPGAPVFARTTEGGRVVAEVVQLERSRAGDR
ncbi:MAG TPA: hypothetical protein VD788_05700 [Candidatus Polarisedimenticolaceae bacterium]|nr:hypothetical protein [Candidatus Polarisedimenticolaceae bacterium]